MAPDDDAQEEIISGPYCRHWSDPRDCEEGCTCGHPCKSHDSGEMSDHGEKWPCRHQGCACSDFTDAEE